jgi:hypothetical protein
MLGAARQVANIFVLLFIFMTMFALLGMQLFGGKIDTQKSRAHYDYYYPAILTVLSTFSGEWVDLPACTCSPQRSCLPTGTEHLLGRVGRPLRGRLRGENLRSPLIAMDCHRGVNVTLPPRCERRTLRTFLLHVLALMNSDGR